MSLIPSESYSFPDHFTVTKAASRNPKPEPEPVPLQPARKKPTIVPLPDPKPQPAPVVQRQNPEPVRNKPVAPPPNPAIRRASAPPPRVPETPALRKISLPATLKPKVRWNQRAPAMDPAAVSQNGTDQFPSPTTLPPPAQNVIQMKPAKSPSPPRMIARPAPAVVQPAVIQNEMPVAPAKPAAPKIPAMPPQPTPQAPRQGVVQNPQADFFQMFAESGETAIVRRRRKTKFRRFVICEAAALTVLLPLAIVGLAHRPSTGALLWVMNISTIASAVAAALIPIFFYALTPTLPEIER